MYCSKCGEADQNANSYCRKCGNFLSSQQEIFMILILNVCVFAISLMMFLGLYYIYATASEKSFPTTLNSTYFTFGGIAFTQILIIITLVRLLIKMNRVSNNIHQTSGEKQTELTNSEPKDFLPPADLQNVVPSVVEETTRNLDKVRRR